LLGVLAQGFGYGGGGDSGADLANGIFGFLILLGLVIIVILILSLVFSKGHPDNWREVANYR
jgi:hypothetical protein